MTHAVLFRRLFVDLSATTKSPRCQYRLPVRSF
jgi:hypothetical protein